MLTTSVLAKTAGVPVFTVRHYTRIGLLCPARRANNGYRIYADSDVVLLRFITNAKALGFTLKEISQILDTAGYGESPCPAVREIIANRIKQNEETLIQMRRLHKRMIKAQQEWKKMEDSMPDGHSVCHLIESFAEPST